MTGSPLQPLISVVVAVYNGQATLQQCLESVSAQTYSNVELIVIDGGSTDGTTDIIRQNVQHMAYWVSEPDRGIYNAWNKALAKATGDWICFLGADDFLWDAQVLVRMAAQLVLLPADIRVAYGQIMLLDHEGRALFTLGQPWNTLRERFKQEMCIPHPAVMHRRSLFDTHGGFDESFRIAGDYALLLRELKDGSAAFAPGLVVTAMRQGGISSRPKNTLLTLREVRRAQQKMGLHWPGRVWLVAMVRVYIRLVLWQMLGEKRTRALLDVGRRIMGLPAYWVKT
jgi:glycosyltransferase involved in cell wall biosynthesis